jgi:hypothetical protein
MRLAWLLPLVLAACARPALVAEPLAAFDGSEILPVAVAVRPLDAAQARDVFGLDPAPMGVAAIAVRVANRAFVPVALPTAEGWAIYDAPARRPLARGLAPEAAADRIAAALRDAGGSVSPASTRALADALARRALGTGTVPAGGVAAGLVYLLPEENVRLDVEGLASAFVAAAIAPVGAATPAGPVAGRLRPR